MTTSIVLLFGAETGVGSALATSGERSKLRAAIEDASGAVNLTVISFGRASAPESATHISLAGNQTGLVDTVLRALGAYALRRKFSSFPLGRLLNSLGPVDQGRVFWRAVRRDQAALAALRNADLAIAADIQAAKTAWIARHRNFVSEAHFDPRSAGFNSVG